MTFCRMCGRPCEYQLEPAVGDEPAVVEDDIYLVAMGNGRYIEVCLDHWIMWPAAHKIDPLRPRETA
jgi:thymidine kinase